MTNKHDNNKEKTNRTDELLNDYLLDVFGGDDSCETVPISKFFNDAVSESSSDISTLDILESREINTDVLPVSIESRYFLVPTIKLLFSNGGTETYSKEVAILILLTSLYFLRRPLSPKVRQCFLSLSKQVIDDYGLPSLHVKATLQGVNA